MDVRGAVEWAIRSTAHEFRHLARLAIKLHKVPRVDADETRLGQSAGESTDKRGTRDCSQ